MCGIGGVVLKNKNYDFSPYLEDLMEMQLILKHRGPNSKGIYVSSKKCGLISTRLSIVDTENSNQPLYNEDKNIVCVFNGEIYNYKKVREDLIKLGHNFRTHGDGETICHAYEEFGLSFVDILDGMFALAIWDEKSETLILARDRFGEKPLYYLNAPGYFKFSSEIQGLIKASIGGVTPCYQSISDYLTFSYIPGDRTGIDGVLKVQPGHLKILKNRGLSTKRYWFPEFEPKEKISIEEASKSIYQELSKSVISCMGENIPIGIFLSGGLDSSSIAAIASMNKKEDIKLFSIGIDGVDTDERKYATKVAQHINTELFCVDLLPPSIDELRKLARHYGQPFADTSSYPLYLLSKYVNEFDLKVVMVGDGADEIFGGYPRYIEVLTASHEEMFSKNIAIKTVFDDKEKTLACSNDFLLRTLEYNTRNSHIVDRALAISISDRFDQLTAFDLSTYLPDNILVKSDVAGMINSVEIRSPFLNRNLAELAFRLPTPYKISRLSGKFILKKSVENILPNDIILRSKKGFVVPIENWLKKDLASDIKSHLLSPDSMTSLFFKRKYIHNLVESTQLHIPGNSKKLWTIFMLEIWLRDTFC
jgi:asparagine synthase (glutamine-hydrolysing)